MDIIEEYVNLARIAEYNLNPQKSGRLKHTSEGLAWHDKHTEAYTSDIAIQFGADESIEDLLDNGSNERKYRSASD